MYLFGFYYKEKCYDARSHERKIWAEYVEPMKDEQCKQNVGRNMWKKRVDLAYTEGYN